MSARACDIYIYTARKREGGREKGGGGWGRERARERESEHERARERKRARESERERVREKGKGGGERERERKTKDDTGFTAVSPRATLRVAQSLESACTCTICMHLPARAKRHTYIHMLIYTC